jgi:hypothetical protein
MSSMLHLSYFSVHTHIDPPREPLGNIHVCPLPVPWTMLLPPYLCHTSLNYCHELRQSGHCITLIIMLILRSIIIASTHLRLSFTTCHVYSPATCHSRTPTLLHPSATQVRILPSIPSVSSSPLIHPHKNATAADTHTTSQYGKRCNTG